MAKGDISVGDDMPTGEPQNGPAGPSITAKDDGTRATPRRKAGPRSGQDPTRTRPGGGRTETEITRESELGSDTGGDGSCDASDPRQP